MTCARSGITSCRAHADRTTEETLDADGLALLGGDLLPGGGKLGPEPGVLGAEGGRLVDGVLEGSPLPGDRDRDALGGSEVAVRLLGVDGGLTGPGIRYESRSHPGEAEAGLIEAGGNLVGVRMEASVSRGLTIPARDSSVEPPSIVVPGLRVDRTPPQGWTSERV
ncbi:hypothetical protein [Methylobacterium gregans]|uniref:hypothetical protein n=1 Tax=Methylobacterium gregans TaxID=374424 RepID=UPI00361FD68A